ncbi:lasso peptide biosynthesis B2 protein [Streptomyces liangshanensis]|uniref:lasso peptide biosynthesis B2 protein n=1 Tax=Streptomyces liangshanensis TaxID=2717324 RepID=UPI0036D807A4
MKKHSGVYAALAPQGVALLDSRRGRGQWRFLDPVGARLWLELARGAAPGDAVDTVTAYWQTKGAPVDQVRPEMTTLAADLHTAGLTSPAEAPVRRSPPAVRFAAATRVPLPGQLAGHVALFAALVLLRCLPVRFAVTAARAATRLPGRSATVEEAEEAFAAVRRAARWWPGRAACLEESLAAHLTAALTGRRVAWVSGARFAPHGAHAWIEAAGHIIGQDEIDRVWPYAPALTVERSH